MIARIPKPRLRRKLGHEPATELRTVPDDTSRRSRKRTLAGLATAILVIVVAGIALVAGGTEAPEATTNTVEYATVKRTDLVSVTTLDGEVASKEGPTILGHLDGTITWFAAEGTKVDRGQPLYAVDGLPVVLFFGSTPAFRDFGGTMTGNDVRQLEENLEALGFETGAVDTTFTSTTASAVKSWQDSLGLPEDGVVELGRIVFAPSALTVSEHLKSAGAAARDGEDVMSTESSERVVSVTLEEGDEVESGDTLSIVLPDNTKIPGKVTSVDTASAADQPGGEGTSTTATVVPDDPGALGDLRDGADIDVERVEDERKNVLVVPVTALLAQQSGGYAVEVRRGGGTQIVSVEPGLYADDLVEITGDVKEGDEVAVP